MELRLRWSLRSTLNSSSSSDPTNIADRPGLLGAFLSTKRDDWLEAWVQSKAFDSCYDAIIPFNLSFTIFSRGLFADAPSQSRTLATLTVCA